MDYKKGTNILIRHRDKGGAEYETVGIITGNKGATITLFHGGEKQNKLYTIDTSTIKKELILESREIIFREINTCGDIAEIYQ